MALLGHDVAKSLIGFKDTTTAEAMITCWKSTTVTDSPCRNFQYYRAMATPIRRPLEDKNSSPVPSDKRMKCLEEDIDKRIERCKKGSL